MKREIIITAIVFFGVGFLVGYMFNAHDQADTARAVPAVTGQAALGSLPQGGGGPSDSSLQSLPEGHPPIDIEPMVKALEQQAAQDSRNPEPPLQLANLYYDNRRFQEAASWYEKALKLDSRNVNARTDLGTSYFNLGLPQQALAEYRKSLEIDPNHQPTIFNTIIVNLEGTHDLAAARAAWERLRNMNPNYTGLDQLKQRMDAAEGTARRP